MRNCAPVTGVVLQFPGRRVTMSNLYRHKDHQQDAQDDCDCPAEMGTRSGHELYAIEFLLPVQERLGRNDRLICA
jgi:hypothetical protein